MSYMKVYRVVCSVYENGEIVDVSLASLLDRLNIEPSIKVWSEDYDLEYVVRYLLNLKLKFRFNNAETFVKTYDDYQLPPFHALTEMGLGNTSSYMNRLQEIVIHRLSDEECNKIFYRYGNDYTKQIKGERYL